MKNLTNADLFARYREAQDAADLVRREIRDRGIAWQHLASYGMKAEAVISYRAEHKVELREAHEVVTAFLKQIDS